MRSQVRFLVAASFSCLVTRIRPGSDTTGTTSPRGGGFPVKLHKIVAFPVILVVAGGGNTLGQPLAPATLLLGCLAFFIYWVGLVLVWPLVALRARM